MKPAVLELEVEPGTSLDLALYPANDDGTPWVLQGFAVSMALYVPGRADLVLPQGQAAVEVGVAVGGAPRDRIRLQMTPTQTKALAAVDAALTVAYHVDLTDGLGAVHRLLKGTVVRYEGAPA